MRAAIIAIFISCSLFSTVSCFWKKPVDNLLRHCQWQEWTGGKCVTNPTGVPKYVIYQEREKIPEKNGGNPCNEADKYRTVECSETDFTAEVFYTTVFSSSRTGGSGTGLRTGSAPSSHKRISHKTISNPCSPIVLGGDKKIRMLGKCDKVRRKRRTAEGLYEFYEEVVEDTVALERTKRQAPILSHKNRDVLFLLDESGSVTKDKFQLLKTMASALVSKFCGAIAIDKLKTRVAAMTFNFKPTVHFDFDYSFKRATLIDKINAIPFNGGVTCMKKALGKAKDDMLTTTKHGARPGTAGTERLLIAMTDGCANCDPGGLAAMRKQFEKENISFVSFFIGNSDSCVKIMKELLTGAQCYEAFRSPSWDDFKGIIEYTMKRACMDGWQFGHSCPT